jgi:hypothetical protein
VGHVLPEPNEEALPAPEARAASPHWRPKLSDIRNPVASRDQFVTDGFARLEAGFVFGVSFVSSHSS